MTSSQATVTCRLVSEAVSSMQVGAHQQQVPNVQEHPASGARAALDSTDAVLHARGYLT